MRSWCPAGRRVAIISNRLWHTRFGGDPGIVGRSVRIGGQSATVVGVMPPGLLLIGTDLWMPWGGNPTRGAAERPAVHRRGPASRPARRSPRRTRSSRRSRRGPTQSHRSAVQGVRRLVADGDAVGGRAARRTCGPPRSSCSAPWRWCCSSPAPTSPICSWRARRRGSASWRCGWRSARTRWRIARHLLTETVLLALAGALPGSALADARHARRRGAASGAAADARSARRRSTRACCCGAWRWRSPPGCWSASSRPFRRRAPIRTNR